MLRPLLLVHRYLGIAICLVMAAWCLSGMVMMYVPYPRLAAADRLAALAPLRFDNCCMLAGLRSRFADRQIDRFWVEMLANRPTLYVSPDFGPITRVDLQSGVELDEVGRATAAEVAQRYLDASSPLAYTGLIDQDQWTVSGDYDELRPLHRFAAGDRRGTSLYVSSVTGELAQRTTRWQRGWNYIGAVTHWLYATPLRVNALLWSRLVDWLAGAGVVLTLVGLYLGIAQWRRAPRGVTSRYRGWYWWHHLSGLLFGLLALTWVGSGLVSMNPWGFLAGADATTESAALRGAAISGDAMLDAIAAWTQGPVPAAGTVQLQSAPLAGELYVLARSSAATVTRWSAARQQQALTAGGLAAAAALLAAGAPVADATLLQGGDRYYYRAAHDFDARFPVYRVTLADAGTTRYYLDPLDGSLLRKVDSAGRWYRWLFAELHQWNFPPALRLRPLWDCVVLTLLGGVTALCLSGAWLGLRRIGRAL
jgi:hypothetical protein